jgi:hypothetical protein
MMADGRLSKCKDCARADVKQHRAENNSVREYDRQRAKLPHRAELRSRVTREWRQAHRERSQAHGRAGRAGLEAPSLCEGCNLPEKLEKHHPDYSKPLLVVWFCKRCHCIADKIRRLLEAS